MSREAQVCSSQSTATMAHEAAPVDWDRLGHSLQQQGAWARIFAIAVGATLAGQALVGFWRWLWRPPGG
ncbi:MAG: hypothetical protein HY331_18925 [Chloroflexi bacterium]|nr:hypothetical protein [Chloroflexota bacterium]